MTQDSSIPQTEIAAKLQYEMKERDLDIARIRAIVRTQFESARRYVRGLQVPTESSLKLLSDAFNWDFEEVCAMRVRDLHRNKHGSKLLDLALGVDPDAQKFVKAWPMLDPTQKKSLLKQLNEFIAPRAYGKAGSQRSRKL